MVPRLIVVLLFLASVGLAVPSWAQNGTVTGRVTHAATGAPLPGIAVHLCRGPQESATCLPQVGTDANGAYAVSAPPDTYYAYTSNSTDYIDEVYDNKPCVVDCTAAQAVGQGTPIVVGAGVVVLGRHFALESGGILTGTVRDTSTGAPIPGLGVSLAVLGGAVAGNVATDQTGRYVFRRLVTGIYSVMTRSSQYSAYMNEAYDNILCPFTCDAAVSGQLGGTPIQVTAGAVTWDKDFSLDTGGAISGRATATAGYSLSGVVHVIGEQQGYIGSAEILWRHLGNYRMGGLPAGRYFAFTVTGQADEVYDNIPWPGRSYPRDIATRGTPITVTPGADTTVNFVLDPGGTVFGRITRADTGADVLGYCVTLFAMLDDELVEAGRDCGEYDGSYYIDGVSPGSYFAVTDKQTDLVTELYDNIPCPGWSCDITSGTPIIVTAGTTTRVDFALDQGGRISGLLQDAASGAPLAGEVLVFSRVDGIARQVGLAEDLSSYTVRGLPTGTYYAFARYDSTYVDEAFDNVPCTGGHCTPEQMALIGTPIDVVAGGPDTVSINFALERRTASAPPPAPRDLRATVNAYTVVFTWGPSGSDLPPTSYLLEAGLSPGTTVVSLEIPDGSQSSYSVPGVPPGRYYVRLRGRNALGTGPPSEDQLVIVNADGSGPMQPPRGLSAWMSGPRLTLTWTAPESGGVPAGYIVDAGTAAGLRDIGSMSTTARAFTHEAVPRGFYFLRVRSVRGADISQPSTEIVLNAGDVPAPPGPPSGLTFTVSGSTVAFSWTAPAGETVTSYVLEAGSASGLANLLQLNTGTPTAVRFEGVPPGRYYVRVRAVNELGLGTASNEVAIIVS